MEGEDEGGLEGAASEEAGPEALRGLQLKRA